jgi:hypothetical protein
MFNRIDNDTGDKVDVWLLTDRAFDLSRFGRRYKAPIGGVSIYLSRPEDTILHKLTWAEMTGGSEKQFGDVRGVYELQHGIIDRAYIEQRLDALGVRRLWDKLLADASPVILVVREASNEYPRFEAKCRAATGRRQRVAAASGRPTSCRTGITLGGPIGRQSVSFVGRRDADARRGRSSRRCTARC